MSGTGQTIGGVDFVALSTHDLEAGAAFYRETLGLAQSVFIGERNYAEFETGNLTLSLINGEQMGIGHHVNQNAIALHVDDVAEARAGLEAKGVAFPADTFDTGVCHMAFFADPDGNALMLHHRYAPRVAAG
jgi:predicted enzyme related to lactoylglutathione lyase